MTIIRPRKGPYKSLILPLEGSYKAPKYLIARALTLPTLNADPPKKGIQGIQVPDFPKREFRGGSRGVQGGVQGLSPPHPAPRP